MRNGAHSVERHRTTTPRIARMLRELEDTDTARDCAADVGKPATNRGAHPQKRTPPQWFRAAAVFIAAGLVAVIAWQARAVEITERAITTTGDSADVDHVPSPATATR